MKFTELLAGINFAPSEAMTFNPQTHAFLLEGGFVRGAAIRMRNPKYREQLMEAAKFTARVLKGNLPMRFMQEAMSTSDFPLMFGDVLDRSLQPLYTQYPRVWEGIFRRKELRDFRAAKIYDTTGGFARLTAVPEFGPYKEDEISESSTSIQVYKWGKKFSLSWETWINDDLQTLRDLPGRMVQAAINTENYEFTDFHAADTGIYNNTVGNRINTTNGALTNNPPLSIAGIADGFRVMSNKTDTDGNPIVIGEGGIILEYAPANEIAVQNFMNATDVTLEFTNSVQGPGSAAGSTLRGTNWMKSRITPRMNPWLPIADGSTGNTGWYMHVLTQRACFVAGFLRGHENPQVFTRQTTDAAATEGSFDSDTIDYKVRHVMGKQVFDKKLTYWSSGTGS